MAKPNDVRNRPAYTVAEAARYLKVAPATLRSWVAGRSYPTGAGTAHSRALIRPAKNPPLMLSFWNLIEAHVLRSLRTDHACRWTPCAARSATPKSRSRSKACS
jgi:hypothetical protein